jgi:hypothetical protein
MSVVFLGHAGSLVFSTNKTDHHDITEIVLKVVLNIIKLGIFIGIFSFRYSELGNLDIVT